MPAQPTPVERRAATPGHSEEPDSEEPHRIQTTSSTTSASIKGRIDDVERSLEQVAGQDGGRGGKRLAIVR
ncbi:hypothetical protein [Actinoallomurus sp. NPDC050550]|uniref:hypothetical protein n=1 Tax=Actinoallomurus sp. NPDC050550 TaxID=3154937 RepID=UPI0033F9542A